MIRCTATAYYDEDGRVLASIDLKSTPTFPAATRSNRATGPCWIRSARTPFYRGRRDIKAARKRNS